MVEITLCLTFSAPPPRDVNELLGYKLNSLNSVSTQGLRIVEGKYYYYYLCYGYLQEESSREFEAWLTSIAPYVVQVNGHHVGTVYTSCEEELKLICIETDKVVFKRMKQE